jgi:hypothetical protein
VVECGVWFSTFLAAFLRREWRSMEMMCACDAGDVPYILLETILKAILRS